MASAFQKNLLQAANWEETPAEKYEIRPFLEKRSSPGQSNNPVSFDKPCWDTRADI